MPCVVAATVSCALTIHQGRTPAAPRLSEPAVRIAPGTPTSDWPHLAGARAFYQNDIATVGSPFPPLTVFSATWRRHFPIYSFHAGPSFQLPSAWHTSWEGRILILMTPGMISVAPSRSSAAMPSDDFDYESILESAEPAPLGRAPETANASSGAPPARPPTRSSTDSCYSPRQSKVALPRAGGTFSPPAPPPPFAPPHPDVGAGSAPQRSTRSNTLSSADYNPGHLVKRKPLSSTSSVLAAQLPGAGFNNHNPEPTPHSSARPDSCVSGSSRYSEFSIPDNRYVCFIVDRGPQVACFEFVTCLWQVGSVGYQTY